MFDKTGEHPCRRQQLPYQTEVKQQKEEESAYVTKKHTLARLTRGLAVCYCNKAVQIWAPAVTVAYFAQPIRPEGQKSDCVWKTEREGETVGKKSPVLACRAGATETPSILP